MTTYKDPRVFSIASGQQFLPTVAKALCDGDLVPGFGYNGDPLALSRATIFVPTRRAARELRSALMDYLGGNSILLPQIRPLGEFDEDAHLFEGNADDIVRVPPPIDSLERQLMLGRMIAQWTDHLTDHLRKLYNDEELTTPVSTADAFWLASDLAGLIDQLQTEDLSFHDIQAAGDAEVSEWWGVTLAFLQILRTEWPAILKERNRLDSADHRNAMLRGEAKRLEALQPTDPIIVAGSTGTIPATSDLIDTIAKLPAGAIVLPGYDLDMSDATAEILDKAVDMSSAVSHPQYGMHHLVRKMGASGLVQPLGVTQSAALETRSQWVKTALEPAPQTSNWQAQRNAFGDDAFQDVAILTAPNEREEAASIAAALREAIADPKAKAALVTPDRMLARRVVTELARYGIEADDSGGIPFDTTAHGSFIAFVFSVIFQPGEPASLLALLKNPIVQIGVDHETHHMQTMWLERLVLRGGVGRFSMKDFASFAAAQISKLKSDDGYKPDWVKDLVSEDELQAIAIAQRLQDAFEPLTALAAATTAVSLEAALKASVLVFEALTKNELNDHSPLYADEAGTMLRNALTQFMASESGLMFEASQWPEIMRAITSGMLVKPNRGGHPRISIWGALEARLQSVDFLILGGLNEGVWPQQTSNDAFLTRGMKARMNMQPPERRIGLAAHDFQMGMGQSRVLLTRSARIDNAPAVASRWIQRLETLAGKQAVEGLHARGEKYLNIVHATEATTKTALASRPNFAPPLHARPTHFSVTEIERLRR
ncbi:MAG: double-strand break repair protein AddB, partial [Pseudomonadota bacterium]